MDEPIKGVVAALLTKRELVINVGEDNGVTLGMKFAVLNRHGIDIHDPETQEVIGSVEVPKVMVEAVRVEPKLTVVRTFKKRRRNTGGRGLGGLGGLFDPPEWVDEWETFRTEQKPQVEELPEEESYVKVGDPIIEVRGNEFVTSGDTD